MIRTAISFSLYSKAVPVDRTELQRLYKTESDPDVKESGIRYHSKHIYKVLHRWGLKQKVPRKVHVNTATDDEKQHFKKRLHKS